MITIYKFVGRQEAPKRHVIPPHTTQDEEEEPREEDRMDKEMSLRRSHNLRDKGSTHHISMSHQEYVFIRYHSHRAP